MKRALACTMALIVMTALPACQPNQNTPMGSLTGTDVSYEITVPLIYDAACSFSEGLAA
jgi:hypothetical protein